MIAAMVGDLATWQQVIGDARLLGRAGEVDASDVSSVASLRRDYPADQVAVALEVCRARLKALIKFGERGRSLAADVAGIEQASGGAVAAYKADRLKAALGEQARIADLCCGIGGDSMAMVDAGLDVLAVDRQPIRAWMAGHNAGGGASSVCADVREVALEEQAVHLDPARRDESARRRAWRLEDYQPGPDVIGRLVESAPAAAVKLSPGVDVDALPWPGETEFISQAGRLVQAVLWTGALAQSPRRATLLTEGQPQTLAGGPVRIPLASAARYLYTFDASIERAGLIGQLCLAVDAPALHPSLGLLTADRVIGSPWINGFELIERMAWRPKRVKQWLHANDGGLVEIKTRGKACDPDREQLHLRGKGSTAYTVFVLRFDTKVQAFVTKRLSRAY